FRPVRPLRSLESNNVNPTSDLDRPGEVLSGGPSHSEGSSKYGQAGMMTRKASSGSRLNSMRAELLSQEGCQGGSMVRASITLPNGTSVNIEGSPDEVKKL